MSVEICKVWEDKMHDLMVMDVEEVEDELDSKDHQNGDVVVIEDVGEGSKGIEEEEKGGGESYMVG